MCKTTRLTIDRGWMLFAYATIAIYIVFSVIMPMVFLPWDPFFWVFAMMGMVLSSISVLLLRFANTYNVVRERCFLRHFTGALVLFGVFQSSYIIIGESRWPWGVTSAFLCIAMVGILTYRMQVVDKVIRMEKDFLEMEGK